MKKKKLIFLAFAASNRVLVYTLVIKLNQIGEIKKPKYVDKNDVPDITLGFGIPPYQRRSKKLTKEMDKEILLAIGWGNIISLYTFINEGDNYKLLGPIGFFQNNNSIIRLGFFCNSIIYFLDRSSQIKAINTAFFNIGEIEENKKYDNRKAIFEEGEKFRNIKYNKISKVNENYFHYRNYIYNIRKCIYIFLMKV